MGCYPVCTVLVGSAQPGPTESVYFVAVNDDVCTVLVASVQPGPTKGVYFVAVNV